MIKSPTRIDIQVEIQPVEFDAIASREAAESSVAVRERVIKARAIQQARYADSPGVHCNAQMNSRLIQEYAWPDEQGMAKLKQRMEKLHMSARAFDRILRVARTIADLDGYCLYPPNLNHIGYHLYRPYPNNSGY